AGDLDRNRVAEIRELGLIVGGESEDARARVKNAERGTARILVGLNGNNLVAVAIRRGVKRDGKFDWTRGRKALLERFEIEREPSPLGWTLSHGMQPHGVSPIRRERLLVGLCHSSFCSGSDFSL